MVQKRKVFLVYEKRTHWFFNSTLRYRRIGWRGLSSKSRKICSDLSFAAWVHHCSVVLILLSISAYVSRMEYYFPSNGISLSKVSFRSQDLIWAAHVTFFIQSALLTVELNSFSWRNGIRCRQIVLRKERRSHRCIAYILHLNFPLISPLSLLLELVFSLSKIISVSSLILSFFQVRGREGKIP